ncbi:hypothetical protein V501_01116 [Pseudogymnoascus sp. VKM F-4519 (FW-2642)]|nr:hypothetical protein V501_01116 [Pseudogymnoascus sp. VKM F-4519 (FW-2642)]
MLADKYVGLILAIASTFAIGLQTPLLMDVRSPTNAVTAGESSVMTKRASVPLAPFWYYGEIRIIIEEAANLAAYAFAPAILVTPLGALSVLTGAVLGSYFLKEELGTLGKLGCAVCLIGSVIIVVHAPPEKEIKTIDEILYYGIQLATIIPIGARSEPDKALLRAYRKELDGFTELPDVILEAATLMRIRGYGVNEGPAFAADVLRIEVVGNTGLHLTVVDLPGLIAVENDEQTEEDIALVDALVDAYLKSSRTIILAVVQANNDIANQSIIRRARKFDRDGQRTVGIITKPDLINKGTEGRIACLAKNESTIKLKLGFFLLKNPSPSQLGLGISRSEQISQELEFFHSWKGLDPSRVGIIALQGFLQNLHSRHIEKELPMVRREIMALLTQTDSSLTSLGDERQTPADIRMFLARLSMKFLSLTQAAIHGNYSEGDFFADSSEGSSTRLRADIHCLNGRFSTYMRDNGHLRKLCLDSEPDVGPGSDDDSDEDGETLRVVKQEVEAWVKRVYLKTRGRELPGNYNHVLLSELYREQSSQWTVIANSHLTSVLTTTARFVDMVLNWIIEEEDVKNRVREIIQSMFEIKKAAATKELETLIKDEKRQPITYNHYYTDNIQNARHDAIKGNIQKAMQSVEHDHNGKLHACKTAMDSLKLIVSLQNKVIVNMDDQACSEALAGLNAYYKVAMKTFVDNVCRQVIERHIVSDLPDLFSPMIVMGLSDQDLVRVAAEPPRQKEKRAALSELAQNLRDSLLHLHN